MDEAIEILKKMKIRYQDNGSIIQASVIEAAIRLLKKENNEKNRT